MRLLDQVHEACVTKHYSPRTEESYTRWIDHSLRFHRAKAGKWIHPRDMTADDVELFLTHLAVRRRVAASTQNQALNALVFLFRDVVKKKLGEFDAVRAKRGYKPQLAQEIRYVSPDFPQEIRYVSPDFPQEIRYVSPDFP